MCNYLTNGFECIIKDLFKWLVGGAGSEEKLRQLRQEIFGLQPPRGDFFMLEKPAEGTPFREIWEATWIDAGTPEVLVLSLAILITGRLVMSNVTLLELAGAGSKSSKRMAKRNKANFRVGVFAVILSYPMAALAVSIVNYTAMWLLPGADAWGKLFSQILTGVATTAAASVVNPPAILMIAAFIVLRLIFEMILWVHDKLLFMFLYGMPLGFAIKYVGIPVLSSYVDKILRRVVPILLMPIATAIIIKGFSYFMLQDAGGFIAGSLGLVGPVAMLLLLDIALYKILTSSVPMIGRVAQKTVGVAAAAGTAAAGGSGIAVSQAYRGNYVRAGIYASRPDFDHAPTSRDEVEAK